MWKKFSYISNHLPQNNICDWWGVTGKKYVVVEKIKCWLSANAETGKKWTELFLHFKQNNIPYQNILKIVEFALSFTGTRATTEGVFFLESIKYGQMKKRSVFHVKYFRIYCKVFSRIKNMSEKENNGFLNKKFNVIKVF